VAKRRIADTIFLSLHSGIPLGQRALPLSSLREETSAVLAFLSLRPDIPLFFFFRSYGKLRQERIELVFLPPGISRNFLFSAPARRKKGNRAHLETFPFLLRYFPWCPFSSIDISILPMKEVKLGFPPFPLFSSPARAFLFFLISPPSWREEGERHFGLPPRDMRFDA